MTFDQQGASDSCFFTSRLYYLLTQVDLSCSCLGGRHIPDFQGNHLLENMNPQEHITSSSNQSVHLAVCDTPRTLPSNLKIDLFFMKTLKINERHYSAWIFSS